MTTPSIQTRRLGIISALHEEQQGLVETMQGTATLMHGMRHYTTGNLWGIDAVCVLSRIGKVAAAMTATTLIERFGVTHIIFTGVAGSGDKCVHVGDVVIAESLVQYDLDASPLFPPYEIPLSGISHILTDRNLTERLTRATYEFFKGDFLAAVNISEREQFRLHAPALHRGVIASGDQFVNDADHIRQINADLPGLLAVEMEGAAVAQVCFELGVPFAVIRAISDKADEEAATDFMHFVKIVAARYAFHIIRRFCQDMKDNQTLSDQGIG